MLEACGAPQSEGDIQEAAALWLRGEAAALLAVDRRWSAQFREDDDLIERLEKEAVNAVPAVPTPRFAEATVADPVENRENKPVVATGNVAVPTPPVSLLQLTERLIEEKTTLGEWRAKTCEQVRSGYQPVRQDDRSGRCRADHAKPCCRISLTASQASEDFTASARPTRIARSPTCWQRPKPLSPKQVGRQGTTQPAPQPAKIRTLQTESDESRVR